MRKRMFAWTLHSPAEPGWLDLESTVLVEITSGVWRAAEPGAQRIRLIFDQPQSIGQT
jgi:hypothetical protein